MREIARFAALVVALVVVVRNVVVAGNVRALVPVTMVIVLLLAGALTLFSDGLITASGVALAAHYVMVLEFGDVAVDLAVPVVGALILLYLDLADLAWSVAPGRRVDRALLVRTARGALLLTLAATVTGVLTFVVAAGPWPGVEWLRAAGALGVGAAVVSLMILARRPQ